jgi:hypothetical protein
MWGGVRTTAMTTLLAATVAAAAPYEGFVELAPAAGTAIALRLRVGGDGGRGEVLACPRTDACDVAGARLTLAFSHWPSELAEETQRLEGTIALPDGTSCTLVGDVWTVSARGRRVRRGGMSATVRCPAATGSMQLWVRGYRVADTEQR